MSVKKQRKKPAKRRRRHGPHTVNAKTLKKERDATGQYPLSLAEARLVRLHRYVKKQGGKLPK